MLRLLGADLPAPHYSTLSRRAARLEVKLGRLGAGPLHLAVDLTGVKVLGQDVTPGEIRPDRELVGSGPLAPLAAAVEITLNRQTPKGD